MGVKVIALVPDVMKRLRGEMTQAQLAEKAGVARATVIRLENGQADSVTFDTLNRIAEALGVDADKLVTFDSRASIERSKKRGRKAQP